MVQGVVVQGVVVQGVVQGVVVQGVVVQGVVVQAVVVQAVMVQGVVVQAVVVQAVPSHLFEIEMLIFRLFPWHFYSLLEKCLFLTIWSPTKLLTGYCAHED